MKNTLLSLALAIFLLIGLISCNTPTVTLTSDDQEMKMEELTGQTSPEEWQAIRRDQAGTSAFVAEKQSIVVLEQKYQEAIQAGNIEEAKKLDSLIRVRSPKNSSPKNRSDLSPTNSNVNPNQVAKQAMDYVELGMINKSSKNTVVIEDGPFQGTVLPPGGKTETKEFLPISSKGTYTVKYTVYRNSNEPDASKPHFPQTYSFAISKNSTEDLYFN